MQEQIVGCGNNTHKKISDLTYEVMNDPLRKRRRKVTVIFLPVEVDGPGLDGSLLVPAILLHLALRGAPPQLHHLGRAGLR